MEITGKVVRLGTLTEGQSARGPWRKQELIIDTEEQYPRTVCLMCWSNQNKNLVDEIQRFAPGQTIKAQIDIQSREYNGKWYTDVNVWRFEPIGATATPAAAAQPVQQPYQQPVMHQTPPATQPTTEYYPPAEDSVDDLPF